MGLDISAWERAILVHATTEVDKKQARSARRVWAHPGWESRIDGLTPGYYTVSGEERHFRPGPYSRYNLWREWLCESVYGIKPDALWENEEEYVGRPFAELICFSDNSGMIGPKTSAKLWKDFAGHEPRLGDHPSDPELFFAFMIDYQEWTRAFEVASRGGLVIFH